MYRFAIQSNRCCHWYACKIFIRPFALVSLKLSSNVSILLQIWAFSGINFFIIGRNCQGTTPWHTIGCNRTEVSHDYVWSKLATISYYFLCCGLIINSWQAVYTQSLLISLFQSWDYSMFVTFLGPYSEHRCWYLELGAAIAIAIQNTHFSCIVQFSLLFYNIS